MKEKKLSSYSVILPEFPVATDDVTHNVDDVCRNEDCLKLRLWVESNCHQRIDCGDLRKMVDDVCRNRDCTTLHKWMGKILTFDENYNDIVLKSLQNEK